MAGEGFFFFFFCSAWGPELSPGSRSGAVLASAMCLCGGDGSWPRQLRRGSEWPAWTCISGWAGHVAPSSSYALQQSPLPSVPPRRAARRLCSLPPAAKMLGGCPGARRCSVASPAPCSHLSPCTACGLRTPERGTWLDHSRVPLQLQPLLSKFLCLTRGGEATRGAKGRARGAPSCCGQVAGSSRSTRVPCGLSWAVEEPQQGQGEKIKKIKNKKKRAGACLVLHGSCCEWLCYLALSLEGERASKKLLLNP